jgi:acyl-CoA reductase-like NAD-dependent aldehyde dehydrogenase
VEHPGVDMITFTGSPEVGWDLRAKAARKRVGLELGNNAPLIIAEDGDASAVALAVRMAGFAHAGQSCISTQRLLVHRSHYTSFVEELAAHVATLKVGDPLDPSVEMSALIDTGERDRVHGWIEEARAGGARLVTGGDVTGTLLAPTVLADVTAQMRVSAGEVFGPVVAVAAFDEIDEAIELANDSRYGLQAAIWTASVATALKAAHALDFGGVLINEVPTWRADQQPYGGKRDSGNTREGPAWTADEMTETKTIVMSGWSS